MSLAVSLFAGTLSAHHSFTATYDTAKTVTIEGKVTQFLLRNPHSFLHIAVIGKDGKEETWNIESNTLCTRSVAYNVSLILDNSPIQCDHD